MADLSTGIKSLAASVGDFIAYWGFRGIHGQLWTAIWLSKAPLSGAELARALDVSKALVSPALAELEGYDLVRQVASDDARAKRYVANPDVYEVIKEVLRKREMRLLAQSEAEMIYLRRRLDTDSELSGLVSGERLEALQIMVTAGNTALMLLTAGNGFEALLFGSTGKSE